LRRPIFARLVDGLAVAELASHPCVDAVELSPAPLGRAADRVRRRQLAPRPTEAVAAGAFARVGVRDDGAVRTADVGTPYLPYSESARVAPRLAPRAAFALPPPPRTVWPRIAHEALVVEISAVLAR